MYLSSLVKSLALEKILRPVNNFNTRTGFRYHHDLYLVAFIYISSVNDSSLKKLSSKYLKL